jgi:hypothetical protein
MGVQEVDIVVKGPGPGRESAIRAVQSTGLKVHSISDITPVPHNGCRPPKDAACNLGEGILWQSILVRHANSAGAKVKNYLKGNPLLLSKVCF